MLKKTFIFLALLFMLTPPSAQAQLFNKKESKKALKAEIETLKSVIDSLQSVINDGAIELSDTTTYGDTINPGIFNFLDSDDYNDIQPGSNPDSLLDIWYRQKKLSITEDGMALDLDSIYLQSDIPDSIYIAKIAKMNSFIPIPYNSIVRNYIIYYTQKIPHKSRQILGLCSYYMPIFEEILDSYGLPLELKVMAIIESALNPLAVSRAKAKGMWQFMYRTALQYDLRINSYVDERLDPVASAHAAAKYLRDSYIIFGDWALAIASYNCGTGNVNKAIRRAGSKDFWAIYPYLPRETRGYVPSFVAALYLINYYKDYQIVPEKIQMPVHVDTFKINKNLHFEQIADNIGIPIEYIRQINPQYLHDIIPGTEREYILRLPYNYSGLFAEKEKEIYAYKDSIYFNPIVYNRIKENHAASQSQRITHIVKSGETLGHIALKYHVRVADIQRWNKIGTKIWPKQRLTIYRNGGPAPSSGKAASTRNTTSKGYEWYTIRKGDTLLGIALKHKVSLNNLLKLNGLTKNSKIYPGKKLKIRAL